MARSKSDHIIFVIIAITTSDNKLALTKVDINPSTNNYTIINKNIKKTIIDYVYNIESNNASIWSTSKTYYSTNRANCCIDIFES